MWLCNKQEELLLHCWFLSFCQCQWMNYATIIQWSCRKVSNKQETVVDRLEFFFFLAEVWLPLYLRDGLNGGPSWEAGREAMQCVSYNYENKPRPTCLTNNYQQAVEFWEKLGHKAGCSYTEIKSLRRGRGLAGSFRVGARIWRHLRATVWVIIGAAFGGSNNRYCRTFR